MNPQEIKKDFPIFEMRFNDKALTYLDNAATTQKPQEVIDAISRYYSSTNANVHRGIYALSEISTKLFEFARADIAHFLNADPMGLIFTKGTTESLNRVAFEWAIENLKEGDEILVSDIEHHSNLLPWFIVCDRVGARIKYLEIDPQKGFDFADFEKALTPKVKLVALTHISNVGGNEFPVTRICEKAHENGAKVVVDGAQAVAHTKVDIEKMDCDFYAFSGHKMYGPMGIGVLWAKPELLEKMPPYEYGGGMIETVTTSDFTTAKGPTKFEAGTPNVAGAVGLAAAANYLSNFDMKEIVGHEKSLVSYALEKLSGLPEIELIGPKEIGQRASLFSFNIKNAHPHDVAAALDAYGIAVRAGQHCAMPYHEKLKIPGSVRVSFGIYNTREDVDLLVEGLKGAIKVLSYL